MSETPAAPQPETAPHPPQAETTPPAPQVTADDPRAPRRGDRAIALALAAATFMALGATESGIGFPRDEGVYFHAAQSYAGWYVNVWESLKRGHPFDAFRDGAIVRYFEDNHEHPVLMKTLFGLSHLFFTEKLHWLRDAAGYRLPAWAVSGLLSALLYLLASRLVSRRGGIVAVLAFWLTPRDFFHGHLAAFDIPIATAWLAVVYCYWRALSNPRWVWWTGAAFGAALAIKHNAWIIPGVFAIHFALTNGTEAWRQGRTKAVLRAARPFFAMLTMGPAILYLHWPYLWHAPVSRFLWYVGFHGQHINYPWEFFGTLLVEAPFPPGYAFAVTAVTVPAAVLLLMILGSAREIARFAGTWIWEPLGLRLPPMGPDDLLLLGNAFASLVVLSMPSVPIFGGVKHWLPSMPFLAIFAARALERIAEICAGLWPRLRPAAFPSLGALVLAPALWGLVHNHPYGVSFYNEIAGGYPGAASLGMHRQYWSASVTGVLPWLNQNAPRGARVYFHEVNGDSFMEYKRDGMLRADIQYAYGIGESDFAAYQYMPEFRDVEFQIWDAYGTQTPVYGLYLDETPQIVVYRRPR